MAAEDALLQQLRATPRDERLWKEFYTLLHPQVFALTAHLCQADSDLAEDVTQDAFVRFIRSDGIQKVHSTEAAVAYLRAIVRNLMRDHFRARAAHPTVSTETMDRRDLERALDRYIRKTITDTDVFGVHGLREEDRKLLRQMIEGRTITEISEHLRLSYSATAVRIHRLRKQIRRYL